MRIVKALGFAFFSHKTVSQWSDCNRDLVHRRLCRVLVPPSGFRRPPWFLGMIGPIKPIVAECWRELRQLDNLEGILLLLGTKFNTSLLADYRCLQPGF